MKTECFDQWFLVCFVLYKLRVCPQLVDRDRGDGGVLVVVTSVALAMRVHEFKGAELLKKH